MKTTITTMLDDHQRLMAAALTTKCCRHDSISLSYPATEATQHILLFDDNGHLICILGMVALADSLMECSAFTLPAFRQQGYFSQLLAIALEQFEECDILFAVDESCADTMAAMRALEAELDSREHLMERQIDGQLLTSVLHPESTLTVQEADGQWRLYYRDTQIGQCETTPAFPPSAGEGDFPSSKKGVCLHHVVIAEAYRRQGFGHDFMIMLLHCLAKQSITNVLLQVSGQNTAAMKLYQKTGFRITRTLSYYYYHPHEW